MKFVDEKYFKIDGDNLLFTGPYMEAYIPDFYFEKGYAEEIGVSFKTMGLFNLVTFNDEDGKNPNPIRVFNVPSSVITYPSAYEIRNMSLQKGEPPSRFVVFKYFSGDIFCVRVIAKDLVAFKTFLAVLLGGKLPGVFSYEHIIDIWLKNMELADINFDISDTIYEMVIAEIYRSRQDHTIRFGAVLGKDPNHSVYDYDAVSPRELTKINSTYTGITFENMDEMITAGVNRANKNTPESISPMEEIMKY